MPRRNRDCPPGVAIHVIQRGNNRQICFAEEADLKAYANWQRIEHRPGNGHPQCHQRGSGSRQQPLPERSRTTDRPTPASPKARPKTQNQIHRQIFTLTPNILAGATGCFKTEKFPQNPRGRTKASESLLKQIGAHKYRQPDKAWMDVVSQRDRQQHHKACKRFNCMLKRHSSFHHRILGAKEEPEA